MGVRLKDFNWQWPVDRNSASVSMLRDVPRETMSWSGMSLVTRRERVVESPLVTFGRLV